MATDQNIFVSYSRVDADLVIKLATELKQAGANLWLDQLDIPTGSIWDLEIEKALEACDCLLFIVSKSSVASNNVLNEVYYALEENKKVFPVKINDCKIPFRIKRLQYIDISSNYEEGYKKLLKTMRLEIKTESLDINKPVPENNPINETHVDKDENEEQIWRQLLSENIVTSYKLYLTNFPNGKFTSDALAAINTINEQENVAWDKAEKSNTLEYYQQYLDNTELGTYVEKAKKNIEELKKEKTKEAEARRQKEQNELERKQREELEKSQKKEAEELERKAINEKLEAQDQKALNENLSIDIPIQAPLNEDVPQASEEEFEPSERKNTTRKIIILISIVAALLLLFYGLTNRSSLNISSDDTTKVNIDTPRSKAMLDNKEKTDSLKRSKRHTNLSVSKEYYKALSKGETPAQFPGGLDYYKRYLERNVKYPEAAEKDSIQGVVRVQLVVAEDGSIKEVKALNDPGGGLAAEAERLVKSAPKWIPAKINGKNVAYRFVQTITFQLQ